MRLAKIVIILAAALGSLNLYADTVIVDRAVGTFAPNADLSCPDILIENRNCLGPVKQISNLNPALLTPPRTLIGLEPMSCRISAGFRQFNFRNANIRLFTSSDDMLSHARPTLAREPSPMVCTQTFSTTHRMRIDNSSQEFQVVCDQRISFHVQHFGQCGERTRQFSHDRNGDSRLWIVHEALQSVFAEVK